MGEGAASCLACPVYILHCAITYKLVCGVEEADLKSSNAEFHFILLDIF